MRALQDVGLVDQVGVSNYSLSRWRAAEGALGRPVLSNQVQYSLAHRGPEDDLLPYAAERGPTGDRLQPAGAGPALRSLQRRQPALGACAADQPAVPARRTSNAPRRCSRSLREVADAHEITMSQAALAYLVSHPRVVAIPGASSEAQVEANAAARCARRARRHD